MIVVSHLSTPEGRKALTTAIDEARDRATGLVVVAPAQGDRALTEEISAELSASAGEAGIALDIVPVEGDLAEGMIETAERMGAELIVIGLRRRSPVGKLLLGAGAQRILLDSPCPVMAVKP
jgi:nucleotide-binding universal stress UspA family protein